MALSKLVRRNHGRKKPVSIKYENLHCFKEGVILLCQSILETRRISHLHGSALFTIPRKLGQHPIILPKKALFFEKNGIKNFTKPYLIPFLSVLHQNKALHGAASN